jgi:glycosyltransferase involved in cell wall biosynthesis
MSRIAIDARELNTSSGRYVERLLYYLQIIDNKNDYLVLLKERDFDGWQPSKPNFKKERCPYKEFSFGEQLGFARQLHKLGPDLVHFPMVQQPAFYSARKVTTMNDLTTTRFRNFAKNRIIFKFKQKVYIWLNRRIAKHSTALITYSEFVKKDVLAFSNVNPNKINVTPLAADIIPDPPTQMENLKGKNFLMYVGRPMSHKNLERLVEAFAKLKSQHPELILVLAGNKDANYDRLEKLVIKNGVKDVVFPGFVSEGQLRWLYENCLAYVFPSLSEGFGLPGLEAMLHGAPIISSNATCLPEVYGDGAHYFDPFDVVSIANAINEVIINQDLRNRLIIQGRIQAAKYSWQRLATQTLKVYESALNK